MANNTVFLKLTSAIAVAGEIIRKGQVIEVIESEAQTLLARGKAELATEYDEKPADVAPVAPAPDREVALEPVPEQPESAIDSIIDAAESALESLRGKK